MTISSDVLREVAKRLKASGDRTDSAIADAFRTVAALADREALASRRERQERLT